MLEIYFFGFILSVKDSFLNHTYLRHFLHQPIPLKNHLSYDICPRLFLLRCFLSCFFFLFLSCLFQRNFFIEIYVIKQILKRIFHGIYMKQIEMFCFLSDYSHLHFAIKHGEILHYCPIQLPFTSS